MSEYMRNKHKIPDSYSKDLKLTNWFKKNLGMSNLEGVYLQDFMNRGTLTKTGTTVWNNQAILSFPTHSVMMSVSEDLHLDKVVIDG